MTPQAMKQIIVNVGGISIEEKQRVSEALAKIKKVRMCNPLHWDAVVLLYGPSSDGVNVGFGYYEVAKTTHTPQQVLEMASSVDQDVILADTLIITDSSGNIIYDSTVHALNRLIRQRAKGGALPDNGVSVKLDKNGAAIMVENRKVRKDFDPKQSISVDVSNCTEDEKMEVQQAFFDAGIEWSRSGTDFNHLSAKSYSNSTGDGSCFDHLMHGISPRRDSISHQQFLSMVYEPEQQGHPHAHLMALYAEDAKTTDKPWELWQVKTCFGEWSNAETSPAWLDYAEYRRKPKTHIVHGVEVPDLRFEPKIGEEYWFPDASTGRLVYGTAYRHTSALDKHRISNNLCYESTEAGRQAAILHAKAWLGIAQ